MNVRTICLVLSADKLEEEGRRIADRQNAPGPAKPGIPLIEGGFMRCGHVFELMDVPKLNRGDLIVFTGTWGDDPRERRVRLHVTAAYLDSHADTWFNVIVVITPPKEHAQADWNHDGVAAVMRATRNAESIDLLAAEQPVVGAAIIGWDFHHATPFMPVMMLREITDPPSPETDESGDESGTDSDE